MPRICCPNHSDCCIDCEGGGYAHYRLQYGPCEKGCDESAALAVFLNLARASEGYEKFSGAMHGVRGTSLSAAAGFILDAIPAADPVDIATIQTIGRGKHDQVFTIEWENQHGAEVIKTIATAVSEDEGGADVAPTSA